jgi:hypothetical protein
MKEQLNDFALINRIWPLNYIISAMAPQPRGFRSPQPGYFADHLTGWLNAWLLTFNGAYACGI